MKNKLYISYGSNLNLNQMAHRCPTAQVVGVGMLKGYKLTFRSVATIEPALNSEVPVGVWKITARDELALDRYEGYPTLYRKEYVPVEMGDKTVEAMVYIMNSGKPAVPYKSYLETIIQGYEDVGLDKVYITDAIQDTLKRI